MSLRRLFNRLRYAVSSTRSEERLRNEIEQHIAFETDENVRRGLPLSEARRQAILKFGPVESIKEAYREKLRPPLVAGLTQDLRHSLRMLRHSPGFAAVVILTIALGVGAATAIFSVVDETLWHPLPYPHPERLVRIEDDLPGGGSADIGMSQPEWRDLQDSGIFENVSPAWYDDNNLTGSEKPQRVHLLIAAPNYFSVLGVGPQLGWTVPPDYSGPGILPEVVISDGLWRRSFAADPAILDKSIRVDTDLYRIVGVMPPGFHDPGRSPKERNIEVWAATNFYGPPMVDRPPRNGRNLPTAIARLRTGMTLASAQSRVNALTASLRTQYPSDYPAESGWRLRLVPLKDSVVGEGSSALTLLFGSVGLLSLIGTVNIANLLLARANARSREMAVRQALGGGKGRLVRQLLAESLLLSLLGGIAGLGVLIAIKPFLLQLVPESLPRFHDIGIHWEAWSFALGLSLVSGAAFGAAPAWQVRRVNLTDVLKQQGRGSTSGGRQARTRRFLVVMEFALSVVLMISAGLLLRSFWRLLHAPLGFKPESVMTVQTRLPYPNDLSVDVYRTPPQQAPFFREVLRRMRAQPGVEEAAIGSVGAMPLAHDRSNLSPPIALLLQGHENEINQAPLVDEAIVSPEYFRLLGFTLLAGRTFTELDSSDVANVAVINETMARTYWPNQNPVGIQVKLTRSATAWTTIVGIVADARTESLEQGIPEVYTCVYQRGAKHLVIFLRGNLNAAATADRAREQVQLVDATIPTFMAQSLNDVISESLAARRLSLEVVGFFAAVALLLAGLGVYGVITYTVVERTPELGIRIALGAGRQDILRMIVGEGVRLATAGSIFGLFGASIVCRYMATMLYEVRPIDPATFLTVPAVLLTAAVASCYAPARRATTVDPMAAIRE